MSAALYQPVVVIDSADILDTAEDSLMLGVSSPVPHRPKLRWLVPDSRNPATSAKGQSPGSDSRARTLPLAFRLSCIGVEAAKGRGLGRGSTFSSLTTEVTLSKEFEKALGARADLYRKGMTARHNGYGIGALPYFRRLIEGQ